MTESMSMGSTSGGRTGEDFVCSNCGCEIMVKHWGEPAGHADNGGFVCHCGSLMTPEHEGQGAHATGPGGMTQGQAGDAGGDGNFSQDDFLGEGGGAGEATGMGRTSSTTSSPGGGGI